MEVFIKKVYNGKKKIRLEESFGGLWSNSLLRAGLISKMD